MDSMSELIALVKAAGDQGVAFAEMNGEPAIIKGFIKSALEANFIVMHGNKRGARYYAPGVEPGDRAKTKPPVNKSQNEECTYDSSYRVTCEMFGDGNKESAIGFLSSGISVDGLKRFNKLGISYNEGYFILSKFFANGKIEKESFKRYDDFREALRAFLA